MWPDKKFQEGGDLLFLPNLPIWSCFPTDLGYYNSKKFICMVEPTPKYAHVKDQHTV